MILPWTNPTQPNPTQLNPTQPNPTQLNPTPPDSTQPNPTQTLGSDILFTGVVGHVLPQKCPGSSDKMCSQTIISTSNTNKT